MNYLIKDEELVIHYEKGKGAWTYYLKIPNTKQIKAKWGFLKVSGTIDNYPIQSKNLAPKKDSDKYLSISETIRNTIRKKAGDLVKVTLTIDQTNERLTENQIIECFEDAQVLIKFEKLSREEQQEILRNISSELTEELQSKRIIYFIEKLLRSPHNNS